MAEANTQPKWRTIVPAFSVPPKNHFVIFAIIILAVFRMYLTGGEEIIPVSMDSENYARSAWHYLLGTEQDGMPTQRPGMPLLARAFASLGIPYALGLEFLYLAAAGAAAFAAGRISRTIFLPVAVFAGLAYCPWLWNSSRTFMTEPLTAVLLLTMCVSAFPFFMTTFRRWRLSWVSVATIPSAFLVITRPEALVVVFFCFSAIVILWIANRRMRTAPGIRFRLAWLLIPVLVTYGLVAILKQVNQKRYGMAALCITEAPDFVDLMNVLYSIAPEEEIRFAPVTMKTLAAACDFSPSMNALRDKVLQPNSSNIEITHSLTGVSGEVGPMLNWHLISAFYESKVAMKSVAAEIRQAQAEKRIGKRVAMYPVDPLWKEWLPEFPQQFGNALYGSYWCRNLSPSREYLVRTRGEIGPESYQNFQHSLLLRPTCNEIIRCQMYCQTSDVPKSQFTGIRVLDDRGLELASSTIDDSSGSPHFNLDFKSATLAALSRVVLEFLQQDGHNAQMIVDFKSGQSHGFPLNAAKDIKEAWGVEIFLKKPRPQWRDRLKIRIGKNFSQIVNVLALLCFVTGVWRRPPLKVLTRLTWLLIFFATFISARCAYYTLVEVWLRWGLNRYVEPNQLTLLFTYLLFAFWLGAVLRYFLIDRRRWNVTAIRVDSSNA